ncbi:MAG: hypothetical protein LBM70_01785 [Victivallales bacterium]|jgi:predicted metal-dependent HD superfamily phosphohydrolase|nr:hypothetical protein [Victivallales bacterium]
MDEKQLEKWAIEWIGKNVDPYCYCYHHIDHVRMFVADVTEFGRASHVSDEELSLLRSAGWLHDVGYALDPKFHEEKSACVAQKLLGNFGYTSEEIQQIVELILATRLTAVPKNLPEKLMRDADLGWLGGDDFAGHLSLLRLELERNGKSFTDLEFWRFEADFLKNVAYFSVAAEQLRGKGLIRNRAWVDEQLRQLENSKGATR